MTWTRARASNAERLLDLERQERRLGERVHRDSVKRRVLQDQIRRLRLGLSEGDRTIYDALTKKEGA